MLTALSIGIRIIMSEKVNLVKAKGLLKSTRNAECEIF